MAFASHGVTLLPKYLENIARGDVTANARPECLTSEGNLQRFHAHNGFGQHAGKVAVNAAIEQTKHRVLPVNVVPCASFRAYGALRANGC